MVAKAGDKVPSVVLYEDDSDHKVDLADLFKGKKGILFGLPGAYTPVCSNNHLPGFVSNFEKFKEAGAEVIVCTSTDNPYVLSAWGQQQQVAGKVRMLADPENKLAQALGVEGHTHFLGNVSKRYSAVIKDGTFTHFNLEDDNFGLACSRATDTLKQLKEA